MLAVVWSVVIGSRGQGGLVGAAPPRWGLAAGEITVDGHRGAMADARGGGKGTAGAIGPARSFGPGKGICRPGEREKSAGAGGSRTFELGRAKRRVGSRPVLTIFVFFFF
jgi:hypothetical protein